MLWVYVSVFFRLMVGNGVIKCLMRELEILRL